MSSNKILSTRLTRRSWVALAVSALSGCGGGGSSSDSGTAGLPGTGGTGATYPGTGGTGIYQGSITGFGSVIVNGVTYDNSQANMQLNGATVVQDRLRLGMVATVRGVQDLTTATGTASSVEVWAIGQGRISEVQSNQFKVAGMTILTTSATWFYDISGALANGAYVSVWGLQADPEGKTWTASCVQAVSDVASAISSGRIKFDDDEYTLNDLQLTGQAASNLADGALVRVQGTWLSFGELRVESAQVITRSAQAQAQGAVEIEGLVTSTPNAVGFMLGGITVNTSTSVVEPAGALIVLGSKVEVYGAWQNGVLRATKVELEDGQPSSEVSIKAPLQQFNSLSDFVLQGQRCNAAGVVLDAKTQAALPAPGAVSRQIFKVKGNKSGDVLLVTYFELDH